MRLNTFGGALDAADRMRTALLEAPFTTVSFIDHQAASAGALISLACDLIYMSPGSTVGSATVVNQNGEPMPEKYQSYMRSLMRATAQETGRDPELAEQMVNGETIVSLTTKEALEIGFSQGQAENITEVVDQLGYAHCEIHQYKETWLDKIIGFFLLPLVQALLLMGMIGGVVFELKTPGVGFPLGLAIVCAICYFSPLFLEGMVQYWEVIVCRWSGSYFWKFSYSGSGFWALGSCLWERGAFFHDRHLGNEYEWLSMESFLTLCHRILSGLAR
jgi:membrane-bound serine protease (ClpP class)